MTHLNQVDLSAFELISHAQAANGQEDEPQHTHQLMTNQPPLSNQLSTAPANMLKKNTAPVQTPPSSGSNNIMKQNRLNSMVIPRQSHQSNNIDPTQFIQGRESNSVKN